MCTCSFKLLNEPFVKEEFGRQRQILLRLVGAQSA